jgi:hypothetical protein
MVALPFLLYLIIPNNIQTTLSISLLFLSGALDLCLTIGGTRRAFREANFYRIFIQKLGRSNGFVVIAIINFGLRAWLSVLLYSDSTLTLLVAFASFAAPIWNSLMIQTFQNDIVLTVPTVVSKDGMSMEISTIEKRRLETSKDFSPKEK